MRSCLNFIRKFFYICASISASLSLFLASFLCCFLEIARYSLQNNKENLIKNSSQIIPK